MNASPAEGDHLFIKQQIWKKFTRRLQEWRETESCTIFPR